jgi:hypothetical protein
MNKENSIKELWSVIRRDLERVYADHKKTGAILSKKNFESLFTANYVSKESAYNPYILEQLKKLNNEGKIDFIGNDDIYFKVINNLYTIKQEWEIILAMIERCYDDGGVIWSKKNFESLFTANYVSKESAYNPYILEQLKKLNDERKIDFIDNDDIYFKVINI